jgi:hypothetical protein
LPIARADNSGTLFEIEDLGPQPLAGFGEPQRAWRVVGESGVVSRFEALRSGITPLVGRDEELDLLLRCWQQAKLGEGRVMLVSGEPGIGKSRLTAALSQHIETEPHTRIRYFCSPHHQDSALYPFIGQRERAAGFTRNDTSATKLDKLEEALLGEAAEPGDISLIVEMLSLSGGERFPPLDLSPQRKKERILAALLRQLQALAGRQPVLMIFEDLHWIDPTSRELLDLAVEKITDLPVLLVATYRPEFQPPWVGGSQVTVIALNRLGRNEGALLVHRLAGNLGALPPDIVDEIVERTDGVPLFVEELTKAVVEAGADRGNASMAAVPPSLLAVPATLHASLLGRLDRLGPAAKTVAQVGAAIGRDFSHELLAAAAPLAEPELQEALRRLVEAGLVFQRGAPPMAEYLFKHALVQDTAYSTLLRGPRQALHRRIAEALEQRFSDFVETRPEIVAHHYSEAALPDKAVIYWHRAGKLSVAKSAVREATAQLRRGLSLLDGLTETRERKQLELDIHITLTQALMAGKGFADPEVAAALERANRLVTETGAVGTPLHFFVLYGLWTSNFTSGNIAAALEHATNFLSSAQSQPSSGPLLMGHRTLAHSLMHRGDYRAALEHAETAASLYRPDEHRDSALHYGQDIGVQAFVMLSWALWHRGYPDQSARAADRALAYSRELGHAHTLAHAFSFAGRAAVFARDVAVADAGNSRRRFTLLSFRPALENPAPGRPLGEPVFAGEGHAIVASAFFVKVCFGRPGCALNRPTWFPVKGSSARVSTIRSATVVRQRFFWMPQPTPTSSQRNTSGRAGWKRLARSLRCGVAIARAAGFRMLVMSRIRQCGDCPLTARSRPKKSGQNIPKNRCRTTVAERMVETRAELPFIGGSGRLLSHEQAARQRTRRTRSCEEKLGLG